MNRIQKKILKKNNYSIPDADRMEIDNTTENDNQNVPDIDPNQQQRPSSHSSHYSLHHSNSSVHSRINSRASRSSHHSATSKHSRIDSDSSRDTLPPTPTFSINRNINDINTSFDFEKLTMNHHSSQYLYTNDIPSTKVSSKSNSKEFLKTTGSRSRIHSGNSINSLKNPDDVMPQINTISTPGHDESEQSKSLMTTSNRFSEISLLSDSMTKEQVSERLLKRLYSVTSKSVPQSHFRFNGKRTTSGVRLNPIVQPSNNTHNLTPQQHLTPINKTYNTIKQNPLNEIDNKDVNDEEKNKYYLKAKKPEIFPKKEHNSLLGNKDFHQNDLLYLLLNGGKQGKQKKNTLKRINNYVQDESNKDGTVFDQQMNHFTPIPPIPSNKNSNKRVKIIDEEQEDKEATVEYTDSFNSYNSNISTYMQPSELTKKNSPFKFIEYIKQHPETNEFIYCNIIKPKIAKGQPSYDPYNLEVVEYSNIDRSNYFYTLSAKGATMFDKNNHAEFTPLDQWLREYKLFYKLLFKYN